MNNYFAYHMHTYYSVLDSVTSPEQYIKQDKEWGMNAICFTEHGNVFQKVSEAKCAHDNGLKFIYGCEVYLTRTNNPDERQRDNYHTILIAKNEAGRQELNELLSDSYNESHFYYKPRITFDEFLGISSNIISTSACIAGPLARLDGDDPYFDRLASKYDYYEVQPHENSSDQKFLNEMLVELAKTHSKKLICGTDCHALTQYEADCRHLLMMRKHIVFGTEDEFDLTFHPYDDIVEKFKKQGVLTDAQIDEAMRSTNEIAEICDDTVFDTSVKYPILHGSYEEDNKVFDSVLKEELDNSIKSGRIPQNEVSQYETDIAEENRVFEKLNVKGYMLFEHELLKWAHDNGIKTGPGRGSVGGSRAAYVLGITDVDAVKYGLVFSRFMNVNRVSEPDIDVDFFKPDRDKIYNHIINRFGQNKTAFVLAFGTSDTKGAIDEIVGGLYEEWNYKHLHIQEISSLKKKIKEFEGDNILAHQDENQKNIKELKDRIAKLNKEDREKEKSNPYTLSYGRQIKDAFEKDEESAKKKYPEISQYLKGFVGVPISISRHPAGIICSPIDLRKNYSTIVDKDDKVVLSLDMNDSHDVHLIKYDILGLNNIGILRDACEMAGVEYPQTKDVNFNDPAVWDDMAKNQWGNFQFESSMAFSMLRQFKPRSIDDLSLLTAALRPSGQSYRDNVVARQVNHNPFPELDNLLKSSMGYIVYQEDIIRFLIDICGFEPSDADSIRRAIGAKDHDTISAAMPRILDGYIKHTNGIPVEEAKKDAEKFMEVIMNSASYGFNKSHAVAYSILTYELAYVRHYHPGEFITSYLNHAHDQDDIAHGSDLARSYKINILPPIFGVSKSEYTYDKSRNVIAKGIASVKYCNSSIADKLYDLYQSTDGIDDMPFISVCKLIANNVGINSRQMKILICIGYFEHYGDPSKLLSIYVAYNDVLKGGTVKKIAENSDITRFVDCNKYATNVTKSGKKASAWTVTNMDALLIALNNAIMNSNAPKTKLSTIIKWQIEYTGCVLVATQKREDIRRVIVTKVTPIVGKYGKLPFSYRLDVSSIMTGHSATIYARATEFNKHKIFEGNIVDCNGLHKNNRGYFELTSYVIETNS